MLRFVADEDFNNNVVRGLRLRKPEIDIVRVQDVGLSGTDDPALLKWAADNNRIMLTHDASSMTKHAYERVSAGESMPGVFEANQKLPIGGVIDEILLIAECSLDAEWEGQVRYLPLR